MRLIVSQMPYHPEWDYDTAIQKNLPKKEDITQETFMSRRLTKGHEKNRIVPNLHYSIGNIQK